MFDRITFDKDVLGGRATIRGLRISVAHIVNLIGNGMTPDEVLADNPDLEKQDIGQALRYAALAADDRIVDLPSASK
jgi:uncharacterized protein (DUF433 family)